MDSNPVFRIRIQLYLDPDPEDPESGALVGSSPQKIVKNLVVLPYGRKTVYVKRDTLRPYAMTVSVVS